MNTKLRDVGVIAGEQCYSVGGVVLSEAELVAGLKKAAKELGQERRAPRPATVHAIEERFAGHGLPVIGTDIVVEAEKILAAGNADPSDYNAASKAYEQAAGRVGGRPETVRATAEPASSIPTRISVPEAALAEAVMLDHAALVVRQGKAAESEGEYLRSFAEAERLTATTYGGSR